MNNVLNITAHKDGTYSISNLTWNQLNALQSALIANMTQLNDLKESREKQGKSINEVAEFNRVFADEASDQIEEYISGEK